MGKALPEIEAIAKAVTAAKEVYSIINRVGLVNFGFILRFISHFSAERRF